MQGVDGPVAERATKQARQGSAFRPDIEGLRGVAVLVVVAFHAGVPGFGGGFVGVDVFFVISGYLIIRILVDQATSARGVGLFDFWARRIRRLVPALAVVVAVTLLIALWVYSPLAWPGVATQARASALYVSNVLFAREATSYFALPLEQSPYLHTWSLGVEEQFYLVWPLLFFGMALLIRRWPTKSRALVVAVLATAGVVSFVLSMWLTERDQPWAFFSSPTRAWEFALGGLASVLAVRHMTGSRAAAVLGWVGMLAVVAAVVGYDDFTRYPGLAALLPVLGAVAVLAVSSPTVLHGPGRALAWAPLAWLGGVSYTWYLWHWPLIVFVAAAFPSSGLGPRVGAALVALVLAWATTVVIENPVRFRSRFTTSRRLTYVGGLGATVIVVAMTLTVGLVADARRSSDPLLTELANARTDKSGVTAPGCGDRRASTADYCVFGAPDGDTTVMLLGDSHGAHWRPALEQVAMDLGVRVIMRTFGDCPAVDVATARAGTHQARSECEGHRAKTAALIDDLEPDAVVVSHADYVGQIFDGTGGIGSVADQRARWDDALGRLAVDLEREGVALGVILDVPALDRDPIECVARHSSTESCDAEQNDLDELARRSEGEQAALAGAGHGEAFDPRPLLCADGTCPLRVDGLFVYADPNHLTRTFSRHLAPQLRPFLESLLQE